MGKIDALGEETIRVLLPAAMFQEWESALALIRARYDLAEEWYTAGKMGYELKFRKSGKAVVSLFPNRDDVGLMAIFGKAERVKFEELRTGPPEAVTREYDSANAYHDGKWVMWRLPNPALMGRLVDVIGCKRKPDR